MLLVIPFGNTIIKKLSELPTPITPEDSAVGMGPAFTEGKYHCRDGNETAFMRIYKQIPLDGTRLEDSDVRKPQARPPGDHVELEALKFLTEQECSVTPRLLGYRIGQQDEHDIVPGGYIIHLVWEQVEGESLDFQQFWALPYATREKIRWNFEEAYRKLLKFGYEPILSDPSKIIMDKATLDVKISGFKWAERVDTDTKDTKWTRINFASFSLALISSNDDRYLPDLANDLRRDAKGWRW
ncbi:uncharacterized protein N7518_005868 [Penicillium psychrosexuale]|uniref:uncharacterized protein n=1 Tax=Penicillium psychrosexuale TaxID=1002107 RepID=UPI002544D395|nr:uncharacterized protein N7518_005868 [Penicillium psychrosexuale]KAJ5788857.1 hypothetical protein N7518_005868 [Penicillium psychrosexuale]